MTVKLNFPWAAVNNRVAKVGVGAYLTAPTVTAVTTAYTPILGTFNNVESEGFFINLDGKLEYHPDDGASRTFKLTYSCQVRGVSPSDIVTVGIETGNGVLVVNPASEISILCRVADSPYGASVTLPVTLDDGDTIELQIKGDSSFDATVDTFNTVLVKFY